MQAHALARLGQDSHACATVMSPDRLHNFLYRRQTQYSGTIVFIEDKLITTALRNLYCSGDADHDDHMHRA